MSDFDDSSVLSSPLSSPASLSPSPPPDLLLNYPSPPASDNASAMSSPSPNRQSPVGDEEQPPKKKRKVSEPKQRKTEYLDLSQPKIDPEQEAQLSQLLKVLHKKRKIVVIAGAGISVSAGIPDFRSSEGLFKTLRGKHGLKSSGKALFDASVYQDEDSTATFHAMVRELSEKTKAAQPTPFHHLLATLAQEGRLLRLYTQNVDGIDARIEPLATTVPLAKPWPKTIQLHGGLDHMVCSKCQKISDFNADLFQDATPPLCSDCEATDTVRTAHAGKRSHGIGKLRPRMVLYNEHNPDGEAIGSVTQADLRARPDALIVVGTTLKVPGVRRITREMCNVVRDRRDGITMWINNDPEPTGKELENVWDLVVKGSCDEVAQRAAMRKWTDDPAEFERFEEVSKDFVEKVKAENGLESVVIISPAKPSPVVDVSALLTPPIGSPRFKSLDAHATKDVGIKLKLTLKKPEKQTANPASKGKKIQSLIGETKPQAKAATKRDAAQKKDAPKKKAASKRKSTGSVKPDKSKPLITKSFAVTKSAVSTVPTAKKFDPAIPHTPMVQIPTQDIRVNSSPTLPSHVRRSSGSSMDDDMIYPKSALPRGLAAMIHTSPDNA